MGGPSSPKNLYPEWQNEYQVALLELDRKKLLERVKGGRKRNLQSYSGYFANSCCGTAGHRRRAGKPARYKAGESRTPRKTKIVRQPSGQVRMLASTVTLNNLTTQELLKHAEDMMREDQEFLKDFIAAVDQLLKRQEQFQTEHPAWGSRYS